MQTSEKIGLMAMVDSRHAAKIALKGVRAGMYLFDNSLRVNLEQRYVNMEKVSIEAVYSFPLPIEATVCGFKVRVGEREMEAQLKERETAFEMYDDAIASGKTAYLLDADTPNHFTCSVGNLAPGEDVTVYLSYVQMLTMRDGVYRLALPTELAMVYTPEDVIQEMDPSALDRLYPPRSLDPLPYGLELSARVQIPGGIQAIDCPSHPIKTSWEAETAVVTFSSGTVAMGGDFVMSITPKVLPHHLAYSCIDPYGGGWIAYARFQPEFSRQKTTPRNITFMLDCSGSMSGSGIKQAKSALLLLLASLQEGDSFNIVAYGSAYKLFSTTLLSYNDVNLSKARAWVQKRDADMGGTEVLSPLLQVLETGKAVPLSIILLTDGDVGNTRQIIAAIRQSEHITRIFTIGLGLHTDEELLHNLAGETGGAVEIVHPNERLEAVISRQLSRIKGPQVQSLHITWGESEETIPVWNQHLLPGESKYFMQHFDTLPTGDVTMAVKLDTGELYEFRAGALVDVPHEFTALPQLYAKYQLQNQGKKHTSEQVVTDPESESVSIALLYGILSEETSFILVDPLSQHKREGGVGLRRVPVNVYHSYRNISQMPFDAIKCCRKAEIPPELMRYCNAFETKQKHEEYDEDFSEVSDDEELPLLLQRITVPSPQNSLREAIVLSQSASGYWDRFDLLKLLHVAKSKFAALVKEIAAMYGLPEDETKIIALSLLVWVHLSYIDMEHRDEHQHLIDKAERWFTGQGIDYPAWAPQWQKIL